jgi:hypothetical protein
MIEPAIAYYHAYLVGDWRALVHEQIALLRRHVPVSELVCFAVAPDPHTPKDFRLLVDDLWAAPVRYHFQSQGNEVDGINALRAYVEWTENEAAVLFFHTKGITKPGDQKIQDWRHLMEYFTIERYQRALETLDLGFDVVGCNFLSREAPIANHFSGNFWWARLSHLRRLPQIGSNTDKNLSESWVTSHGGTFGSLHESGIDHYLEAYPRSRYA